MKCRFVISPLTHQDSFTRLAEAIALRDLKTRFYKCRCLLLKPPLDDTSEKQKISDKDQKADFNFSQIMEKGASNLLPSKSDAMQATQNLVDKKILTNLTIIKEKDSNQGNPLRNKVKKKKRLMQELAKFDDELLAMLPADKLSSLLENKMEQGDSEAIATSLRVELKQMIADEMANGSTQKEIAKTSLPANTNPGANSNSHPNPNPRTHANSHPHSNSTSHPHSNPHPHPQSNSTHTFPIRIHRTSSLLPLE